MSGRLEEIKEVFGIHHMQTFADRETIPFNRNDIAWLINRVEELEEENKELKEVNKASYWAGNTIKFENQRYKQALEEIDDDMEHLLHYGFEGNDHLWRARKVIEQALKGE